ncbi:DUF1127 domain-containing protein [Pseudomonas sp. M30-35]|uniref:DUF1127 domain-containing protein n=1 Tax=Pseudomonas sp. M30-35 TaxID=1981174 RepID=UPI000B3D1278|nr:DUF1127 domain-containing protein [Pseudomonas sp. M30-35]ARU88987.1 hypothetical protein B9K09_13880 [Pseudomonas sp. M30-35]
MKAQKGYAVASVGSVKGLSVRVYAGLIWAQLKRWNQLAKERHQLATLSDDALKDIGLTRADAVQESERAFWIDPLKRSSK